ncbi:MAG TPA: hypothetical protein VNQ31_09965 [Sphingomonadaceae bacterium]|nr:hypothetical protein [Sphingomonadaceae bacterium]
MEEGKLRHRLTLFGRPVGPWRASREAAEADALRKRLGSREPWERVAYLGVGVAIQSAPRVGRADAPDDALCEVADLAARAAGVTAPGSSVSRSRN